MLNEKYQWITNWLFFPEKSDIVAFSVRPFRYQGQNIYPQLEENDWGTAAIAPDGVGIAAWLKPEVLQKRKAAAKNNKNPDDEF